MNPDSVKNVPTVSETEKVQTAVDWLIDAMYTSKIISIDKIHPRNVLFSQARKMQEEQLNTARLDGINLANKGYGKQ